MKNNVYPCKPQYYYIKVGFKGVKIMVCFRDDKAQPFRGTKTREKEQLMTKTDATFEKKGKRKVQGMPQSQATALPGHQEEEETDKTKQAQIEQTYEKHLD